MKLNNLTHDREEAVLRNNNDLFTQQSQSMVRREKWMTRREELLFQRELKLYVKRDREEETRMFCSGRTQSSCASLGSLGSKVSLGSSRGSWSSQDSWDSMIPQFLTPNRSKLNALKAKVLFNLHSAINRHNEFVKLGNRLKLQTVLSLCLFYPCPCLFFWPGHVSWLNV